MCPPQVLKHDTELDLYSDSSTSVWRSIWIEYLYYDVHLFNKDWIKHEMQRILTPTAFVSNINLEIHASLIV